MKLIIDRNIWLRGTQHQESFLLRPKDGKRCCIGIYLQACGVTDDQTHGVQIASDIDKRVLERHNATWTWDGGVDSIVALLYEANDDTHMDEEDREDKIADLFTKVGVDVEFTRVDTCIHNCSASDRCVFCGRSGLAIYFDDGGLWPVALWRLGMIIGFCAGSIEDVAV